MIDETPHTRIVMLNACWVGLKAAFLPNFEHHSKSNANNETCTAAYNAGIRGYCHYTMCLCCWGVLWVWTAQNRIVLPTYKATMELHQFGHGYLPDLSFELIHIPINVNSSFIGDHWFGIVIKTLGFSNAITRLLIYKIASSQWSYLFECLHICNHASSPVKPQITSVKK